MQLQAHAYSFILVEIIVGTGAFVETSIMLKTLNKAIAWLRRVFRITQQSFRTINVEWMAVVPFSPFSAYATIRPSISGLVFARGDHCHAGALEITHIQLFADKIDGRSRRAGPRGQ